MRGVLIKLAALEMHRSMQEIIDLTKSITDQESQNKKLNNLRHKLSWFFVFQYNILLKWLQQNFYAASNKIEKVYVSSNCGSEPL